MPCDSDSACGPAVSPLVSVQTLGLSVTHRCNLNCSYCSADAGPTRSQDMTVETAIDAVTQWLGHTRHRRVQLVVGGGEPLCWGLSRLSTLFGKARESALTRDITLGLGLQTNATLVDEAAIEMLTTHRVEVGLSLDGPPHVNDLHRQGGALALAAIQRLMQSNVAVSVITCLTREVADELSNILEWFMVMGIKKVRINPVGSPPPGRQGEALTAQQLFEARVTILEHMLKHQDQAVQEWNTLRALAAAAEFRETGQVKKLLCDSLPCAAGLGTAALNPDGQWALCIERSMSGGLPIGDLASLPMARAAFFARRLPWPQCENCRALPVCDQGCPAYHGNKWESFREQCRANLMWTEYLKSEVRSKK